MTVGSADGPLTELPQAPDLASLRATLGWRPVADAKNLVGLRRSTSPGSIAQGLSALPTMWQLVMTFPFLRWSDYLTVPSVLEIPGMGDALATIRLWQAIPRTAIYLYHAVHDKYPAIADVDRLVGKYRREGVDVTYRRFRFGGHGVVLFAGVPSSLGFLGE
jgi:hypothetical protein